MALHITSLANGQDGNLIRRREHDDSKAFDLPRLPVRTTQERRPRLPPTLSGLYEPPPSAGLLPSISVERPEGVTSSLKSPIATVAASDANTDTTKSQPASSNRSSKTKTTRNKWTSTETKSLLQGVARFGIGNWTKILRCPDYDFGKRTALDLKDRFRVCCPDQYGHRPNRSKAVANGQSKDDQPARPPIVNLVDLGIQEPFARSARRRRHGYTDLEDQQLLRGFQKYGKSWSSIQQDTSLGLGHRTRTDLRDRMRTRYPQVLGTVATSQPLTEAPQPPDASDSSSILQQSPSKLQSPTRHHQGVLPEQNASSWLGSDAYLMMAFDDAEFDEPITLDRGILDWPIANASTSSSDVPRPALESPAAIRPPAVNIAALPSLATITAPNGQQSFEDREMLELPALPQFLMPPLEIDERVGAHAFLSLDELLS